MSSNITPTIGRRVWYWPAAGSNLNVLDPKQPMDAGIVFIHHETLPIYLDGMVNLDVADHGGKHWTIASVPLWNGTGDRPNGQFCEWMPYQKGQAAKTEEAEKQAASKPVRSVEEFAALPLEVRRQKLLRSLGTKKAVGLVLNEKEQAALDALTGTFPEPAIPVRVTADGITTPVLASCGTPVGQIVAGDIKGKPIPDRATVVPTHTGLAAEAASRAGEVFITGDFVTDTANHFRRTKVLLDEAALKEAALADLPGPIVRVDADEPMLKERIAALEAELETERMRLTACGVAAMANTRESFEKNALEPSNPYYSASYADVRRTVAREMDLRDDVAALRKRLDVAEELREQAEYVAKEAAKHELSTLKVRNAMLESTVAHLKNQCGVLQGMLGIVPPLSLGEALAEAVQA